MPPPIQIPRTTPPTATDPLAAARIAAALANRREPAFWWLIGTILLQLFVVLGGLTLASTLPTFLAGDLVRGDDRLWVVGVTALSTLGLLVGAWAEWRFFRVIDDPQPARLRGASAAAAFSALAVGAAVVVPAWVLRTLQIDIDPKLWRVGTVSLAVAVNHVAMFLVADRIAARVRPAPTAADVAPSL